MDATHEGTGYDFRKQFRRVASRLTLDEAYSLSYIYGVDIPSSRTEALPMLLYVFTALERKGRLTPDNDGVKFLIHMLEAIDRHDLKKNMSEVFSSSFSVREPNAKQKKIPFYFQRESSSGKKKKRQPKITNYIQQGASKNLCLTAL